MTINKTASTKSFPKTPPRTTPGRVVVSVVTLICLSGTLFPVSAQETATPTPAVPTLTSFLTSVWDHHPGITARRTDVAIQQLSVTGAEGIYDPVLSASVNQQKDASAYVSQVGTVLNRESLSGHVGVSQKLSTGADVGFNVQSVNRGTDTTPYNSRVSLDVSQPLLRGFGSLPTNYSISNARFNLEKGKLEFYSYTAGILETALDTYSRYLLSSRQKEVYKDDIAIAQYLVDQTRKKAELNMATELDMLEAQIQLNQSQEAYQAAEYTISTLQRDLALITGGEKLNTAAPEFPSAVAADPLPSSTQALAERAVAMNPDILRQRIQLAQREQSVKYYHNQTLPDLNLIGSLGYNQSADGFGDTFGFQEPSFAIGLSTRFPWGNRRASSQLEQEKLALQNDKLALTEQTDVLSAQVANAVEDLRLKKDRVAQTGVIKELAEKKLVLERRRFDLGLQTTDKVIEAQKLRTQAFIQAEEAMLEYWKARFRLDALTGNVQNWINETYATRGATTTGAATDGGNR